MGSQIHMAGGNLRWLMAQKLLQILSKRMGDLREEFGDSCVEVDRIGQEFSPESFSHCQLLHKSCYQRLIDWLADDFLNGKIISSLEDQSRRGLRFLAGHNSGQVMVESIWTNTIRGRSICSQC
jgi:hypothetical protein